MNFSHYLPSTAKRILRLQRIIRGRNVAILLPGYSITGLEKRITELKGLDICYAGVNSLVLEGILEKINKHISILMCSANPDQMIEPIYSFLDRKENNTFISERLNFREYGGQNLVNLFYKYDEKLLFFTSITEWDEKPDIEFPLHFLAQNSLSILISVLLIGKPRGIILFGADGGRVSAENLYYNNISDAHKLHPDGLLPNDSLMRDTKWFNQYTPLIIKRLAELYKSESPILNCSLHSHLNVFPKYSYDETISYLRGR